MIADRWLTEIYVKIKRITVEVAVLHQGALGQMTWLEYDIHRPGSSSPGSALPSPAYCFASVIV